MNRAQKEEIKKYKEARKGKSPEEIKAMNKRDKLEEQISTLAQKIHTENFPEEYDYMYDRSWDKSDRNSGKNPMKNDYIAKVNARRVEKGFDELTEVGMAPNDKTYTWALQEAERRLTASGMIKLYQWMQSWNLGRCWRVLQKAFERAPRPASIPSDVEEMKYSRDGEEVIFSYEDSDPYDYVVVRHGDYEEKFLTGSFAWFMGTLSEEGLVERFLDGIINRDSKETNKVAQMVQKEIDARCEKISSKICSSQ